ncbi:ferritin-like domain-containing protein [Dyadobacter fanqingshengii]|uniref:PA2169 family four-helix-bundle protein n=1 Tax=Dyadobacter fanqingshengii TaxID=2906443 RepID=A0A9X1T8K2_9BACT|nr:PA2169 family four-helix-bundle protein [Dyadobacter fanqingshengii]MCF0039633.1 PA2169 family four-helix-bundle protein [Dyadobacter fanqingshengii]USJ38600.1 PA2169 family four-helix-bundle protein [Dyadobacter fanqingshengii]
MATIGKTTGLIEDLIEINNDRVAGFEKAIEDINDENIDLKAIFEDYAQQSRKNVQELSAIAGSAPHLETEKSVSGTLHRAWIDVKSLFGGSDRASILSEAERGEDAIKKAYQDALVGDELMLDEQLVVRNQAQGINAAHDRIKALRDVSKA